MNIYLLSVAQAAQILRITRQAVFELVQRGRIPATMVGHRYVIDCRDVELYQRQKEARKR